MVEPRVGFDINPEVDLEVPCQRYWMVASQWIISVWHRCSQLNSATFPHCWVSKFQCTCNAGEAQCNHFAMHQCNAMYTYWQLYNNIMKDGAEYVFRTFNKMVEYDILTLKVLDFRPQATHSLVERPKNWVFTLHWVQGGPSARGSFLTVPMGCTMHTALWLSVNRAHKKYFVLTFVWIVSILFLENAKC